MTEFKVGDMIKTWWAPNGALIQDIKPYQGKYNEYFKVDLTIHAPNTKVGYIVMPHSGERHPAYD
jgi:hypothetical protein